MCKAADSPPSYAGNMKEPVTKFKKAVPRATGWGTRHTFVLLGFFGFLLCYALRFNLSIAIVAMVKTNSAPTIGSNTNATEFPMEAENHQVCIHPSVSLPQKSKPKTNATDTRFANLIIPLGKFAWTEETQGLILGSFFWGYVITQYPGGRLSHRYGPKWVFSIGILITGVLSAIIPIVTLHFDDYGLIVVRFLQGLAEGVTLPSILVMLAHWAPEEERGRMTNWVYAGIPIGTAVTMIAGGYLINFFDWPSVFYVAGGLSVVWFIFWTYFVFNDPTEHPRISEEELLYIQYHHEGESMQDDIATPWASILTSFPVWTVLIADLGDSWSHYLLHVEAPIYLSDVHGFDIETDGLFAAMPQITNCIFSTFVAYLSDFIIAKKFASVLFTRKLCSTIALWGSAIGFIGMILGGCNTWIAIACLNLAAGASGASNSGWVVNHIEIAPNHAGTISGVTNSIGNILGFLAPFITGLILEHNPSLTGWKIALGIPAVISFSVNLFYLAFASAEVQPWNNPNTETRKKSKALSDADGIV